MPGLNVVMNASQSPRSSSRGCPWWSYWSATLPVGWRGAPRRANTHAFDHRSSPTSAATHANRTAAAFSGGRGSRCLAGAAESFIELRGPPGSEQVALGLALALDAIARVGHGLQALLEDHFLAVLALAVRARLDPPERLVDLAQRVAVALEQLEVELL